MQDACFGHPAGRLTRSYAIDAQVPELAATSGRPEPQGIPFRLASYKSVEVFTMSKQVRVALVLAAVSIIMSVAAEWAIRHLTEPEPHHH